LKRDFRFLTPPEIHAIGKKLYRSVSGQGDLEEAILYFSIAAEMDYPPSQNMYAYCLDQSLNPETASYGYFSTIDLGSVEFKKRTMIKYYKLAAQAGHKRALNNLGVCYIQGNGVTMDVEKGMNLLFDSKQAGDKLGSRNYDSFTENHNIPHRQLSFTFSTGRVGARGKFTCDGLIE
jgi:TPR repeat protein